MMTWMAQAALGTVVTLVGVAAPLHATEPETAYSAVEVRVGAVLASNRGNEFDHRLASMRRQFDNLFSYTSYRLVREETQRVAWGANAGFHVPDGPYVLIIPREYKNERVLMKVVVIENSRPIVDTLLSLRNQGTFLVGGQRQSDGVLILAIGANPVR